MQVGQPWKGHTGTVLVIAMNPTGTLLASPSEDHQVRLWRLSDRRTIAIFKHTGEVDCATFSTDGKHILSGGSDRIISKWAVPSLEDIPKDKASHDALREDTSKEQVADNAQQSACEILTINTTARDACITGDWDRALDEALKVIKLTPSSHVGYQFRHAALHGAQRYDEAIEAFKIMLSKLENAPDTQTRKLRQQYINPSEAERDIQVTIKAQLDDAPDRLLNTFTGRLCNREGRIDAFKTSTEYKELFSSTLALVHVDLRMERIKDVVEKYFRYVTLSHRWEVKEPLLNDIQGKGVDELNSVVGIVKLQSFCKTARAAEHRWGWIDTCCIDQTNNVELQTSLNSMFDWYHTSALTMVYLSDVSRSSNPGALARSAWNTRGWTLPELLAPKVIRFYQNDWTPYLNDHSDNHKLSDAIVQELKDATGIDAEALADFSCRKINARKKLQWASTRVTTKQEDIAYSLFGIFDVQIHLMYGEKKEKALGRFLEKVVAELGDISALDWVGQSSKFNSCLPADITSYKAPPYTPPPLSEHDIQTSISLLRQTAMDLALKLYDLLENLKAPRFADRRLHLPCIAFRVTAVKRSRAQDQEIYEAKADGLHDLLITTKDKLIQFSPPQSTMHRFVLVRPCNRYLDLPDFAEPSGLVESVDSKLSDRALRLTARLAQPFGAFLLAHQHGTAYKRIAPDHDIIAQVKNLSSIIPDMVKTLEIL
ncbi:hypothetical protein BDR05DRAFT_122136 [Suillus weaverae]|nr:hypothetical protein BDR05DRAFT_122136 [Suillus weaverae]